MRFLFLALALVIGCAGSPSTSNFVEVIPVSIGEDKIPVYCHTTFKRDAFDLYFVSNSYTVNLPEGWTLEMDREENFFYFHLHKKDATFSYEIACDNYPAKSYRNFSIKRNGDIVQTLKLPLYIGLAK
jgi:hypothetical protein